MLCFINYMADFLDNFLGIWEHLQLASFGITIGCFLYNVGLFWGFIPMISRKKIIILWIGVLQFIPILFLGAEMQSRIEDSAMNELHQFLNSPELEININGKEVIQKDSVIAELRKEFYQFHYHHSGDH